MPIRVKIDVTKAAAGASLFTGARALVLSLEPHVCDELNALLDELAACPHQMLLKVALAHAKNVARAVRHKWSA